MVLERGMQAPNFTLPNIDGSIISLHDFQGAPALLVMFICNHCPFVIHLNEELVSFANEYQKKGLAIVAINSNDQEAYEQDGPKMMKEHAKKVGYSFPYLFDETQEVAKQYFAACTPDFFLFDANQHLVYRGEFDDTRPKSGRHPNGKDMREAVDTVLSGRELMPSNRPSIGCNIKWKPGNEPEYFHPH